MTRERNTDADTLPFPIVEVGLDGRIEHLNGYAASFLGHTPRELVGRPFHELVGSCWQAVFRSALARETSSGRGAGDFRRPVLEVPVRTSAGEQRSRILMARGEDEAGRLHLLLCPASLPGDDPSTAQAAALGTTEEAILCTDSDGRILYCNQRFRGLWKIPGSALDGDRESVLAIAKQQLEDPEALIELCERAALGSEGDSRGLLYFQDQRTIEGHARPLRIEGELVGQIASFRDVTRHQRARETIRSSERRYRLLFERNVAGVFRATPTGEILEVNEAFARLVGYDSPLELQGRSITEFYASLPDRRRFGEELARSGAITNREIRFSRKDGSTIWVLESSILVEDPDGRDRTIEGTIVDITARKRLETELERMAYHDPLTDLANRRMLEERARMSLAFADRHGIQAGLIYLDLSRFKRINDTLGHEAGDAVLVKVARRIRSCLRGSDTAARIGGDEFACLLAEVGGERGALAVARRIADRLGAPLELGQRTLHVDAQIGVALYPDHAPDFEGLLAAADRAMYRTKLDGNPAIEVYSAVLDEPVPDEIAEEEELREAIDRRQLALHYQPVVRLADGMIIGAEALVRWHHPARGLLQANEFIGTAERSGVIRQLDQWVLTEAFRQAIEWEGRESPRWISVNQSIPSLRSPEITEFVADLLRRMAVPPGRIVLELSEKLALDSPETVTSRLRELRDMGLRVALDDFGTGHSTLAYIKHFPTDLIKLDGFFVHDLGTNYDSRNLLKAVIQMGQTLGVAVVAEKVETESQYEWLKAAGCDLAQGYYTGRPVPPEQLLESSREAVGAELRRPGPPPGPSPPPRG